MSESDVNLEKGQCEAGDSDVKDSRAPHHEITIELRQTNRRRLSFKPRNINEKEKKYIFKDDTGQLPVMRTLDDILTSMTSGDPERQLVGMQQVRKLLSRDTNPPIDLMIENGIVPICIRFLQNSSKVILQFEATWALTNIVSGSSEQTRCVIEQNAVPHLVSLLRSKSLNLSEQAVWALGNIAGDGAAARDIVIQHNVVDGILRLMKTNRPLSFVRTIVWLMSNLCRNRDPPPPFNQVKRLLPVLAKLLFSEDSQVLADACWALSYVTENDNDKIQAVVNTDAVPRLVNLLENTDSTVVVPALRTVGNIVAGTDEQTDAVIAAGGLPKLGLLLRHSKRNIVKEAAWTVSNIAAGSEAQIQEIMDADIFHQIRWVLDKGDFKSQKEAIWVVTNMTMSGNAEQVISIVEKYKILKPFINLLDCKEPRTIEVVLNGLINLFMFADVLGATENLCLMVDDLGGLDRIVALKCHGNDVISKQANSILTTYYKKKDGDDGTEQDRVP